MTTKTRWDKIVTGQDLAKIKSQRSKTFITRKERTIALPDLIDEGWEKIKEYKDPKFVGVKKDKPFDEQFEDKVWLLFAKMGFTYMNTDRHFEMSYDFRNPEFTQQIDVFAADEESVIIVECKAAEKIKDGNFKKGIEALHGQMEGLAKEARKQFPNRKVKFIWATHNFILSKADQEKLKEWDIIHFGDAVIDYYLDLVKHLGSCAKYQLLGNLFANTEIKNMEDKIPAIQGKMGGFTYYSFSIEPERLLKIGYVLHRNEANKSMMPTYQRLIKKKRLTDVQKFVNDGGYFPNSLIISIDTNGRGLKFDQSPTKVENCLSKLGVLYLPKRYRSAYIIDGQHRLYGYSDSEYAVSNSIPVVAFVDLDRQEQIKLFMDINENQKAVPKTLRVTLNADMLWESDDYNERRQALRSKISQMLAEEETSPLLGRIVVGEDESSSIKCITVEAIQSSLRNCNFFSTYGKNNVIIKDGTFDLGENQSTCDLFYPFIEECLRYVKLHTENEWAKDKDCGMITINRGIQAIIRVINDIVDHLIGRHEISPKIQKTSELVEKVCFYLDPLNDYLNNLTDEQRKDLRGYFGGGADKRFWRAYQKAVADARGDFKPDGLNEYWLNEAKLFNNESTQYLREIETEIKYKIAEALRNTYGEKWEVKALPRTIYDRAKNEADNKNYENVRNDNYAEEITIWECVSLSECKTIAISGNHWTSMFDKILTRPEEENMSGGKEARTEWLKELNTISNKLSKPTYSVSVKEYELIKSIRDWLLN